MRLQDEVIEIVRREGVLNRKQHPGLATATSWLVRKGALVAVLPGIYCASDVASSWEARALAAAVSDPALVLTGTAAARLTYSRTIRVEDVGCAVRWDRADRRGFAFTRRVVPPELVVRRGRFLVTDPALTALDLCGTHGADAIDEVLRSRTTTLARLHTALELTRNRDGNLERRRLLLDSRDEPWSAAERLFHRQLRAARITGWKANRPVVLDGARYFLDVAFASLRLVVEIDGRLHEDDRDVFENDRLRQNALVLAGWTVLRFTWRMLQDHPERVIEKVRRAVASLRSAS